MSSSYDRNIDRLRQSSRQNTQQGINQRNEMANIMGQRGIQEAAQLADNLKDFSGTMKKMHEHYKEEQLKVGLTEYKQYKKVNAEKYLDLERQITEAKGNEKRIEELRREQIDLKGVNGYVNAERISHLSDYAQIGFVNAQLQTVKETFEPKLQDAMQNSDQELEINGIKFKTKDIHNANTEPLEFKRAGIEAHADNIWKNSGLDRYSPEMLEYAGVTKSFDKAKESLNSKYTQRYNIEKGSQHREKAEKIFDNSAKTGDDIELLWKGVYSTFDGKGSLMSREDAWKVVDSKLVSAGLADGNPQEYITKILDQPIPERWAKQLGVKKGTTFAEHWPSKAKTLIDKAEKAQLDSLKADLEQTTIDDKQMLLKFEQQKDKGPISERRGPGETEMSIEDYEAYYTSRGLDLPDEIKNYKTAFDKEVDSDREQLEQILLTNPQRITPEFVAGLNPLSKAGLESKIKSVLEANEKDIMTDIGPMNPRKLIASKLNYTLEDMNLVGQEKNDVQVYSVGLLEEAYMEKFYENIDKGMTREEAARDALYGDTGVLTDVNNNQSNSQYIKSPFAASETAKFKPDEITQAYLLEAKEELNKGYDWRSNHIGGSFSKKHLDTIEKNIAKYGLWRGLDESKEAVSYYKRLTHGKHFAGGGDYLKFIDSQLRLNSPGHPGFFGAEIEINNYNHKLALNKALFDYESGLIDDKFGFNEVWNDSLRTLEFNDIDHWLHASGNVKDSFDIDSGFWSEADNISFITDYDLEFGEIN